MSCRPLLLSSLFLVIGNFSLVIAAPLAVSTAEAGNGGSVISTEDGCCKILSVQKRCAEVIRKGKKVLECTAPYSNSGNSLPLPESCGDGTRTTTENEIVDHCPTKNPKPVGSCGDGKHEKGDLCNVNQTVIFLPDQWCIPSQNSYPTCGAKSDATPVQEATENF